MTTTTTTNVRFNRYHVAGNGRRARVFYSLDNRTDGRRCVTLYARDYEHHLAELFGPAYENRTDSMTDLFDEGSVDLFEDHPLYATARARVEFFRANPIQRRRAA